MILPFRQRTKEHHDTMRQISRSETPSGLREALIHIARSQQPEYWFHACPKLRMDTIRWEAGQICLHCYIDQFGVHHGRGGAT